MRLAERPNESPKPAAPTRLELLDGFLISRRGDAVHLPESTQRLLAFLALQSKPVPRGFVAEALWLDSSQRRAAANLRSVIHRLRLKVDGVLEASQAGLAIAQDVEVDVLVACEHAEGLLARSAIDRVWDIGAELLRGDLLPFWYDDWVLIERERVRQLFMHALEAKAEEQIRRGHFAPAIDSALAAVRFEPLRETPRRLLLRAHMAEGNRSEAIREQRQYTALLHQELGARPSNLFLSIVDELQP